MSQMESDASQALGQWLRPLRTADYDFLYNLEIGGAIPGGTLRHQGATPPPEQYAQTLWSGVLCQFIVTDPTTHQGLGLATCYKADFRNGHAFVAAITFPPYRRTAVALEGHRQFIDHVFVTFPFRKLYAEVHGTSFEQFRGVVGRGWREEGRLQDHIFMNGDYTDLIYLSVDRTEWSELDQAASLGFSSLVRDMEQRGESP